MKQSIYQNQGHEELSYDELFQMANVLPTRRIVKHNAKKLIPRKIPRLFLPQTNDFAPKYDNLLYCIVLEQGLYTNPISITPKKYFFSPSITLFATLMRHGDLIPEILGKNDGLNARDLIEIEEIMNYLQLGKLMREKYLQIKKTLLPSQKLPPNWYAPYNKARHILRKRLGNILNIVPSISISYIGRAYNTKISSKFDSNIYEGFFKQGIIFNGHSFYINPAIQARCDCGFHKASFAKYEYDYVLATCTHMELARQVISNPQPQDKIRTSSCAKTSTLFEGRDIFSPFSTLDNPLIQSKFFRFVLRKGLYNFLVPQKYIRHYYDDANNYHKRNGFTWFRCELDAFLLSFQEIYNPSFLKYLNRYNNEELSTNYTAYFFSDVIQKQLRTINAVHAINPLDHRFEHLINGEKKRVLHYAIHLPSGKQGKLQEFQYTHNKKTLNHEIIDKSLIPTEFSIFHVYEDKQPIIDFESPFQVSLTPEHLRIFIAPYKLRKSR